MVDDGAKRGLHFLCLNADLERQFEELSFRHTARHGFRTYDLIHVASALLLGCDTFWTFDMKAARLAVRFQYESHDAAGQWWRSYGNELWQFSPEGLMHRREASINDQAIDESQRRIFGPRPEAERGVPIPLQ